MNIYNPPTASQVIGLGTAALKNIGTSGSTVPVCNGAAVTWAAGADFAGNVTARGDVNVWGGNAALAGGITSNSGGGGLYMYANGTDQNIRIVPSGTGNAQVVGATGLAAARARLDALRIDQAAAAGAVVQTHTITISANGVDYKLLAVAA